MYTFILQLILIPVIVVVFSNNLFKSRSISVHSLLFSGSAGLDVLMSLLMIQIDLSCKMKCAMSFPLCILLLVCLLLIGGISAGPSLLIG